MAVAELLRKHGISRPTFYHWKQKFGGAGVPELPRLKARRWSTRMRSSNGYAPIKSWSSRRSRRFLARTPYAVRQSFRHDDLDARACAAGAACLCERAMLADRVLGSACLVLLRFYRERWPLGVVYRLRGVPPSSYCAKHDGRHSHLPRRVRVARVSSISRLNRVPR